MDEIRKHYLAWIRDAHAMEEQAATMLRGMIGRLEDYPGLRSRLEQHLAETERQAEDLRNLAAGHESTTSALKNALGRLTGAGQALSGLFTTDEVVKGVMAGYAFEHVEIAAYRVLIAAAEALDDRPALQIFQRILAEEVAMAEALKDQIAPTTRTFLAREGPGAAAGA